MVSDKRPQSALDISKDQNCNREADCIYAIITGKRPVSRRNRASWFLSQLNKVVRCDLTDSIVEPDEGDANQDGPDDEPQDIKLVSVTCSPKQSTTNETGNSVQDNSNFLITPSSRVSFLSRSVATTIVLDLSPSIVSVSSENGCVFLDSIFDALKRTLHLLVKSHEIPSSTGNKLCVSEPKVFLSVIAYTPFIIAKNNQVIVQNRRISSLNIGQVLVEIWLSLKRLTNEIHELVSSTCGVSLDFDLNKVKSSNVFTYPHLTSSTIMRHPGSVLEDIFELGLFASSLMPRLSRLSIIVLSDGLFSSANDLNVFRIKSIAVSFVSLAPAVANPDSCFGYTPYTDLMRFVAKTTLGVYVSHQDLTHLSQSLSRSLTIGFLQNPLNKLFCWTLHSEQDYQICSTPLATNYSRFELDSDSIDGDLGAVGRFFNLDQPTITQQPSSKETGTTQNNYNSLDWRLFKQLDRNLDADFEQVLACLLREGYLIKYIQIKRNEQTRIVARLVLHWRYNLDLEQELTAPYWNSTDAFEIGDSNQLMIRPSNAPLYGDTNCEIFVHGSYSFLHNLYCNRKTKRRSEYRELAYKQFRQLIDSVCQTHDRLQYLSRFYRDSSLSKVPPYLLHGNSLLYEQPHTHRLTSTIENVMDEARINEFQEYWQKISCLDTRSWKNLMHVHTLRLILEHDQPKHKNIQHQNANGRYTHVQCRRSLEGISKFIKGYASFALLEDSTYIKFIYNRDDDLREIETSATKGFIVIRISKLLPILVVHLMFTSGILDSHRVQIVSYLEEELTNCKLRPAKTSVATLDNILKCKTISPSSETCCVSIKSPLERMLKVYSRKFIVDFLVDNWAHGLPGSCPYSDQRSIRLTKPTTAQSAAGDNNNLASGLRLSRAGSDQQLSRGRDTCGPESSLSKYNLVFGKYLYGIRVVDTIRNLPHDILPLLTANILSKISAILVNTRIKQGFHIAFNSAGILNLVVELSMKDPSNQDHSSNCLCQYIVFPPTIVNTNQQDIEEVLGTAGSGSINHTNGGISSKPSSLNGSLANSDGFLRASSVQDSNLRARTDSGEIKIIREYWIEQQYGLSASSDAYHDSLKNKRYSEVVDHLFLTDSAIFECLLTYDILQLLCDRLSPFYDLDISLSKTATVSAPTSDSDSPSLSSPTNSCDIIEGVFSRDQNLPSCLIEPSNNKDGCPMAPLLESEYRFSLVKFLDHCQLANLNILLFRDTSEFFTCPSTDEIQPRRTTISDQTSQLGASKFDGPGQSHQSRTQLSRKMSADISDYDTNDHQMLATNKREHRSSYQNDVSNHNAHIASYSQSNSIYSASLNHLFLETLHRRFKQMHDKELKLSDYDLKRLPSYLKQRKILSEDMDESSSPGGYMFYTSKSSLINVEDIRRANDDDSSSSVSNDSNQNDKSLNQSDVNQRIEWRCYLRRANQDNLMIILIPDSLTDVAKWLELVSTGSLKLLNSGGLKRNDPVCPVFVFRCSSTMMNEHVLSFMNETSELCLDKTNHEADLSLHFGQPCKYMNRLMTVNDELNNDILSITRYGASLSQTNDEKTLEVVHFRAFLRKIKNTVLKSRFSSLNDAYLSELFVHKDDILYYMNNVDLDTQKKYHVSSHLRNLAEFIKSYQDYNDALPKEPGKACNKLLNSILLQKCGLFINQPIARYDESNPLMRHLHDKKLLFLMRCNYRVELPLLEETLAKSSVLRNFVATKQQIPPSGSTQQLSTMQQHNSFVSSSSIVANSSSTLQESPIESSHLGYHQQSQPATVSSSLGKPNDGSKIMEMKCGSVGGLVVTPGVSGFANSTDRAAPVLRLTQTTATRFGSSSSGLSSLSASLSDSIILEAFRSAKTCALRDISDLEVLVSPGSEIDNDVSLRHEAHLAEVLRRSRERKESHHYRRVLKSKGNYNQSHSAIDQALKKVDSLGRLEHFCLTPLLFSTSWRSKLAPVRDHTIEAGRSRSADQGGKNYSSFSRGRTGEPIAESSNSTNLELGARVADEAGAPAVSGQHQQDDAEERWHQIVCNNYIKEYEQYIQTLGFNSVQIRQQSAMKTSVSPSNSLNPTSSSSVPGKSSSKRVYRDPSSTTKLSYLKADASKETLGPSPKPLRKGSIPTTSLSPSSFSSNIAATTYNTGYLIKFLNGGCLVFKVGFCKPYVYSILYSIEGERFNSSSTKMNMATFLDELDSIKVTLHLHSFTYDYHLRGMYSYISGRQLTFSPGYHLISFLDDFRKYYQKAPNYARNHILSGEICISDIGITGQQLYNYIVTHNSTYSMDVLEMSSSFARMISNRSSSHRPFATMNENCADRNEYGVSPKDPSIHFSSNSDQPLRSHANDYVLIELKREKVRYRDGKDPDIFDCALLITHDFQSSDQHSSSKSNTLTLKYFLLLTNQRDLYPKLIHTYDSIISLGCHRPIRLGITAQLKNDQLRKQNQSTQATDYLAGPNPTITVAPSRGNQSDPDDLQSSELQSSGEVSGPQSIISTANSVQSSSSGLQFGPLNVAETKSESTTTASIAVKTTEGEDLSEQAIDALTEGRDSLDGASISRQQSTNASIIHPLNITQHDKQLVTDDNNGQQTSISSVENSSHHGDSSPTDHRLQRAESTNSSIISKQHHQHPTNSYFDQAPTPIVSQETRTICDEEITYLGYFSSDEMDMLRFLQEKTNNLRQHIEQVVRSAEVHYQRDFLWHKLMQRATPSNKSEDLPLSVDELVQLLGIVEAIDLTMLDSQLTTFSSMHINWHMKLVKAFADLKISPINQHRIYNVKASKLLVLFIDPKCTTAFVLLTVDAERATVEQNLLMRDKQDCAKMASPKSSSAAVASMRSAGRLSPQQRPPPCFELDQDCQQLINDFVNFCATFMWSTFLSQ